MKKEKVEFTLQVGDLTEDEVIQLEEGLGVKCEGGNEDCTITIYSDYENVKHLLGLVKNFLDNDIPVVMRKCYDEVEDIK